MMLQPSSLSPWFLRDKNKKTKGLTSMKEAGKQSAHSKRRFWLPALFCVLAADLIALISNISDAGVGDWLYFTFHPVDSDDGGIYLLLMYVLIFLGIHIVASLIYSIKKGKLKEKGFGPYVSYVKDWGIYICLYIFLAINIAAIFAQEELYSPFLLVLFFYSIYYIIKSFFGYIRHKENYKARSNKSVALFLIFCVALQIAFGFGLSNVVTMKVVGHENVATGFSVVHNKDGSIKHREDGSIVEDIEYERQEIRGLGLNYAILLCPIILIGSTSYFFYKKKEKDDIKM